MKRYVLVILAGVCFLGGCRKRATPPSGASKQTQPEEGAATKPASPSPAQSSATPAATKASSKPEMGNYLPGTSAFDDLTKHLAFFVGTKKRFPTDVDELLNERHLPKPVLPPGGKLVINQKTKTVDYVGPQ